MQVDTMKVGKGLIQFTAIDDCTRYRVLALYNRRTAENAVRFLLDHMLKELPFPIQRIQSDRGGEFFGLPFQLTLHDRQIKFRPVRPYSPHLNGKGERSQLTDKVEFYATVDLQELQGAELSAALKQWQRFYNTERAHGGLTGRTPLQRCRELAKQRPSQEQVWS